MESNGMSNESMAAIPENITSAVVILDKMVRTIIREDNCDTRGNDKYKVQVGNIKRTNPCS